MSDAKRKTVGENRAEMAQILRDAAARGEQWAIRELARLLEGNGL